MDEFASRPRTLLQVLSEHGLNFGAAALGVALLFATAQHLLAVHAHTRAALAATQISPARIAPVATQIAPPKIAPIATHATLAELRATTKVATKPATGPRVALHLPLRVALRVPSQTALHLPRHFAFHSPARAAMKLLSQHALKLPHVVFSSPAQVVLSEATPHGPAGTIVARPVVPAGAVVAPRPVAPRPARVSASAVARTMPDIHWRIPVAPSPKIAYAARGRGRFVASRPHTSAVSLERTMPDVHWRLPVARSPKHKHRTGQIGRTNALSRSARSRRPPRYNPQPALAKISASTEAVTLVPAALPTLWTGRRH